VLSFLAVVYQLVDSRLHPQTPRGIATIVIVIAFFGSLNLLAISLVGEYLIRTFEEVKRRPKFIRKAMWHGGAELSSGSEIESFVGRRRAARRSREAGAG
jgi:dolichol-phosphate mannosyltransferase